MEFGEVLSRSWKIVWKHKVLWIFGILSSCGRGGQGRAEGGSAGGASSGSNGAQVSGGQFPPFLSQLGIRLSQAVQNIPGWVFVLAVVLFLLLLALAVFLTTIGRIGLIRGTLLADSGAARLGFGELLRGGIPFFWRIFGLNILTAIVLVVAIAVLLVPLILLTIGTLGVGVVCLVGFVCLLVPILWGVGLILEQAQIAIVAENTGILAGLRRGWEVVRVHLGPILVMAIILGLGGWVVGLLIALPMLLIAVPVALSLLLGGLARSQQAVASGLVTAGLCFVAYLPVLVLLGGILEAYTQAAWTLTFRRLAAAGQPSQDPAPAPASAQA